MDCIKIIRAELKQKEKELEESEKGTDQQWNRAYGAYFAIQNLLYKIERAAEADRG